MPADVDVRPFERANETEGGTLCPLSQVMGDNAFNILACPLSWYDRFGRHLLLPLRSAVFFPAARTLSRSPSK